ncbi:acyltransferase family protein [Enterobacter asburiae]|uniref:acyltransferase family protein n=1 Tax=Enterobacter asburiae TaxID=61645 RepID=UPI0018C26601|nr:acyltransferase [Enterobacter asburiae]MBF9771765.1 acyltransferase [Enterobacter asburiae]
MKNNQTILNIQYLRFAAAFVVIFAHANLLMYGIPTKLTSLGAIGVDVFFVISGFIMPYILFGGLYNKVSTIKLQPGIFFLHRIIRIWPAYFIVTLLFIAISIAAANGFIKNQTTDFIFYFNDYRYKIDYIVKSLLFLNDIRGPILTAGWTLQFEFIFYSLISLSILFGARKFHHIFLSCIAFVIICNVANLYFESLILKQLSRPILIEFIFGMAIYYIYSCGIIFEKRIATMVCVLFIPATFFSPFDLQVSSELSRIITWGIISSLLVFSFLSLERYTKNLKSLHFAGNASYSIYLTHGVLAPIIMFVIVSNDLLNVISLPTYLFMYTAICISVGFIFYTYIEKPITKFLKSTPSIINKIA